ncbi:DUF4328 domain-containing protein [Streptomyces sp. ODS28]|uniref:protein kinase domain-containing protein n=1 Tax=Streptomyces sp. ODS28 TaxID=3136688 RepID=UPI0031E4FEAD
MEPLNAEDPRWIGGYRLLSRLGEGGMGRVYLARSDRGRTVAVKVVRAELARQSDFRKRFALEVNAARKVGGEWTAPVLDADTEAATPWVATGYVAGPSLTRIVEEQYGPLPRRSALALASGLVQALRAVHGAGLVHRDLKPSNVLITIDGPRVIDFGIARALDSAVQSGGGLTSTGGLVGSPGFMSPEQVRGQPVTPASDVFCLGAVLAYAATGRMPFGTQDSGIHALLFRIAEEDPDLGGVDGALLELITACLTKDPEGRPAVDELAEGLDGALAGGAWLPGEVLAELGRHAVQLLDSEDPEGATGSFGGLAANAEGTGAAAGFGPAAPTGAPGTAHAPGGHGTPHPGFGAPAGAYGPPAPAPYQGGFPPGPPAGFAGPGGTPPPGGPGGIGGPGGTPPPGSVPAPGTPPPGMASHGMAAPGLAQAGPARPQDVRSGRSLAGPLTWVLGVFLAWLAVHLIVDLAALSSLSSREPEAPLNTEGGVGGLGVAGRALRFLGWPLFLCVMVLWLGWFWRMRLNAESFAPGWVRYPAGMALGCWFIPVCYLFMPKQIANDIWTASTPEGAGLTAGAPHPQVSRPLLTAWWTLWLAFFFVAFAGFFSSWYDAATVDEAVGRIFLAVFMAVTGIPATLLAIPMVRRLTALQDSRIASVPAPR